MSGHRQYLADLSQEQEAMAHRLQGVGVHFNATANGPVASVKPTVEQLQASGTPFLMTAEGPVVVIDRGSR